MLVQEIKNFLQLTDGYEVHPDVSGAKAFLLRGVTAYYLQKGLPTCEDINRMVFALFSEGFLGREMTVHKPEGF